MKIIETGMNVRLLVDDVTGGLQVAGMVGRIEHKELDATGGTLYWVATTRRRPDGQTVIDRAPYYEEDLDVLTGTN